MDVLTDVLAATRIGGVVTSTVTAYAPWGFQLHDMPFAAFHAVTQGACWIRRPGAEPLQIAAGDITLLPFGSHHIISSAPTGKVVPYDDVLAALPPGDRTTVTLAGPGACTRIICGAYAYDRSGANPVLSTLPPVIHLSAAQAARNGQLDSTLRMLTAEVEQPRPGSQTVIDRLVDVLFVHILRTWIDDRPDDEASWLLALRDPDIARAIGLLHQRPAHRWTVEELASDVGLSRAAFARRFTALVGVPPLTHLTRWRIELAARRLRDTNEAIASIARAVGYSSEFAFSKAFSRARGLPPGQYRLVSDDEPTETPKSSGPRRPTVGHAS